MSKITTTFAYEDKGFAAIAARLDFFRAKVEKPLGGLKKLNAAGSALMEAFAPLAPIALGVGAALLGVGATAAVVGAGLKKAFDVGGALSDLSAKTGAAVGDLMVLQQAFTNAGIGAEKVGPAINKMQKALTGVNDEGEPTNKVFAQLGLNMEALKSMSSTDQLDAIGKSIAGLSSPAERTAAAMGLFGKSGADMLVLFSDAGALGDAAKDVGNQAALLEKNAALFDKISDILGTAGTKLQGFFVGMGDQLAPIIEPLVDLFRNTDFSGFGQQIGKAIAIAFQGLTDGSIWGIVADGALVAVGKAVNFLWKSTMGVVAAIGQSLINSFENAATYFQVLGTRDFWVGMGTALLGIAASFGAALLNVVADLIDALSGIPIVGDKIGKGAQAIRDKAKSASEVGGEFVRDGIDTLEPARKQILARQAESAANLVAALQAGFSRQGDAFDVTPLVDKFNDNLAMAGLKLKKLQDEALASNPEKKKQTSLDFTSDNDRKDKGSARLTAIGGFGVFLKDPMIAEARKTNQLLLDIKKNTSAQQPNNPPTDFGLRFVV